MAKDLPILTLLFQPRDEGAAEQPMYVRGSRTQGRVLGDANLVGCRDGRASRSGATDIHRLVQLRPIQPQPSSDSLSMSFWRKPIRRDEIGAVIDGPFRSMRGCGFPSTAGSQAGNVLNLLRSTSSIDLRTASQKISKARRVPVYLKRDDTTPQGTLFLSIG
jgi:hypothetical protein